MKSAPCGGDRRTKGSRRQPFGNKMALSNELRKKKPYSSRGCRAASLVGNLKLLQLASKVTVTEATELCSSVPRAGRRLWPQQQRLPAPARGPWLRRAVASPRRAEVLSAMLVAQDTAFTVFTAFKCTVRRRPCVHTAVHRPLCPSPARGHLPTLDSVLLNPLPIPPPPLLLPMCVDLTPLGPPGSRSLGIGPSFSGSSML